MACRSVMQLKGLDEYLEAVQKAGGDVDDAADRALIAGAEVVLPVMEERVPVGRAPEDPHPGLLKANLARTAPVREGNLHTIEVGVRKEAPAEVHRYGNVNEYGSTKMAAQTFIRNSMDEKKAQVRAAERKSLEKDGML